MLNPGKTQVIGQPDLTESSRLKLKKVTNKKIIVLFKTNTE